MRVKQSLLESKFSASPVFTAEAEDFMLNEENKSKYNQVLLLFLYIVNIFLLHSAILHILHITFLKREFLPQIIIIY